MKSWITLAKVPLVLLVLGKHVPTDGNKTIWDTEDLYKGNGLQKVAKLMCCPFVSITGGRILAWKCTDLLLKGISYLSLLLFGQRVLYVVSFSECPICSLNKTEIFMASQVRTAYTSAAPRLSQPFWKNCNQIMISMQSSE